EGQTVHDRLVDLADNPHHADCGFQLAADILHFVDHTLTFFRSQLQLRGVDIQLGATAQLHGRDTVDIDRVGRDIELARYTDRRLVLLRLFNDRDQVNARPFRAADKHGVIYLRLQKATGGTTANPFVAITFDNKLLLILLFHDTDQVDRIVHGVGFRLGN